MIEHYEIVDDIVVIAGREIPWARICSRDYTDFYTRWIALRLETGYELHIEWTDGTRSDNFARWPDHPFVEAPLTAEVFCLDRFGEMVTFVTGTSVLNFVTAPRALSILDDLSRNPSKSVKT